MAVAMKQNERIQYQKQLRLKEDLDKIKKKRKIQYYDLRKLSDVISEIDAFHIFSNFANIFKIVKPFIDSWNKRSSQSPMNSQLAYVFTRLNQRLSRFENKINKVFPQYIKLKKYFQEKSGISIKTQEAPTQNENIIEEYLKKIFAKDEKKSLPQVNEIRKHINYEQNRILVNIQNKLKDPKNSLKNSQYKSLIYRKLQERAFPNRQCLVCTKFFYEGSQFTYDPNISEYEVDIFSNGKNEKTLSLSESSLKGTICSFLNSDRGGVILGGCEKNGTSIVTYGFPLTQKDKEANQQRVQKYMESFQPKIQRNKQIFIDFVPVYRIQGLEEQHKDGLYVMRIFIVPTEPHNTYFYKLASSAQISDDNYIEVRQNGSSITLEGEDVYKEIKRRVMVYSSIKNSDNLQLAEINDDFILNKKKLHHLHYGSKCVEPKAGIKKFEKQKQNQKNHAQEKQKISQGQKIKQKSERKEEIDPAYNENKQYKNISILVADQKMKDKLENVLRQILKQPQEANGKIKLKRWKIQKRFEYSNFYMIPHTWLIYHDDKFETIKKYIDKNKITFKGKKAPLIATTKNLEINLTVPEYIQGTLRPALYQIEAYEQIFVDYQKMLTYTFQEDENTHQKYTYLQFMHSLSAIYVYLLFDNSDFPVKFVRNAKIKRIQPQVNQEGDEDL